MSTSRISWPRATSSARRSVSDGVAAVTNSFILLVEEVNQPPAFGALTNAVIPELVAYSQAILVTDADLPQQTLSLRLVTAPTGARLEGGNSVWTPDEAQGPSTNVVLKQVIATSIPGGRWIGFRASVFSRGPVSGQGIPPELP